MFPLRLRQRTGCPDGSPGRAVLLGNLNVGIPLRAAGAPVSVVCDPGVETRFSRYYGSWLCDPRPDEEALVQALVRYAHEASCPVGLFYQTDADLLFVSRQRERLSAALRFVIPEVELVEQLTDKAAFHDVAERHSLPVPQTRVLELGETYDIEDVIYPVIVKPVRRDKAWNTAFPEKAVLLEGSEDLRRLLDALAATQRRVLVQQAIPGPETCIETYHAYVDSNGDVATEFTGRKLRTFPPSGGYSTAVETAAQDDVARSGREVLEKLQLRGVAKVDFKRDPAGRLWLLEINPRFNLWHRVGAVAGANIPGAVWADLMGLPRPPRIAVRPGVTWCDVTSDWPAARSDGVNLLEWLQWLARRETLSVLDLTDPKPLAVKGASVVVNRARRLLPAQRRSG